MPDSTDLEKIDDPFQVSKLLVVYKERIDENGRSIEQHTDKLSSIEGRVENLEKLYGAQLIWKIDNVSAKMDDAKKGLKASIFSQPFMTSRHGYKLALTACLYGDGKAKGKYMSLFVCICKGEYDNLLSWPFNHRVTLTLIDQCQNPEARRNHIYLVKPNICKENKPFLGKPVGDRNASFGAQKFVEIPVMRTFDYIRDNTMFIKVQVDCEDMVMI